MTHLFSISRKDFFFPNINIPMVTEMFMPEGAFTAGRFWLTLFFSGSHNMKNNS